MATVQTPGEPKWTMQTQNMLLFVCGNFWFIKLYFLSNVKRIKTSYLQRCLLRSLLWLGEWEIYFLQRKKRNQLVLNLFMDFLVCAINAGPLRVARWDSGHPSLMCLKGNYHWCCFAFSPGQRAPELSGSDPPPHFPLPLGVITHKAPGQVEKPCGRQKLQRQLKPGSSVRCIESVRNHCQGPAC